MWVKQHNVSKDLTVVNCCVYWLFPAGRKSNVSGQAMDPTSASYQGMMGEREQEEVLAMDFRDMQS